ncbi:LysR substrate-binding domain-containing protein [Streptomyces sp. UH6]|uniref:LysR substrate-binding domain-containing protein n=1 Tax=Streptomyces sp. UH6 TaxID=2748379 RepID=UPI0015D4C638|nr:LysR substrate-binding domain-containing protein [Streptomyces sp. UH6]NYV72933.1 LysR family transcriptional regulator [Streptomyces sp. UH6]
MTADFTLRQLAYFVAAAETGTTAAAAKRFYMNQSSMSAALSELETSLGVKLFIRRRGKGLELTSSGRDLLPEARRLVREIDEFASWAGSLQSELRGRLVIGCFDTIAPALLPPLLKGFAELHPDVEVDFLEGGQSELQEALLDGRIELSLMYDYGLPASLDRVVIRRPAPNVLVPADHPVAALDETDLLGLADEPFIMISTAPAKQLITAVFQAAGVTPKVRFSSANFDHIRALVQLGMGYSMISQSSGLQPLHWNDKVVAVPVSGPVPHEQLVAVLASRDRLTRRARAFLDHCLRDRA